MLLEFESHSRQNCSQYYRRRNNKDFLHDFPIKQRALETRLRGNKMGKNFPNKVKVSKLRLSKKCTNFLSDFVTNNNFVFLFILHTKNKIFISKISYH